MMMYKVKPKSIGKRLQFGILVGRFKNSMQVCNEINARKIPQKIFEFKLETRQVQASCWWSDILIFYIKGETFSIYLVLRLRTYCLLCMHSPYYLIDKYLN